MKKLIIVIAFLFVFAGLNYLSAQTSNIGSCSFEGKQPSSSTMIGSKIKVYHNGSLKMSTMKGKVQYWKVDGGDVWVIFYDYNASKNNKFLGGNIQICEDF